MCPHATQAETKSAEAAHAPKDVEPITEEPEAEAEAEATATEAPAEVAPAAVLAS
jgi:hypothetical protein